MGDEKPVSALVTEQRRVMRAFAYVLDDYDSGSEYGQAGYEILKGAIPGLTDSMWREVTGQPPPDSDECRSDPYSCCGYCSECESHHDGAGNDEVCDMGHCHSCEHRCSSYD